MSVETKDMPREEILEEVKRAASENRIPFSRRVPSLSPESEPVIRPTSATPSAFDLKERKILARGRLTESLSAQGEWYEVPGTGAGFYVFGVSDADYRLLMQWSLEKNTSDVEAQRTGAALVAMQREQAVAQVIVCCRQGPTLQSDPVYTRADRDVLSSYLGYAVIDEIVAISGRLSGNDESFGMGVRSFFEVTRRALRTSCSAFVTWDDCPPGLTGRLLQVESLLSRALSRGKLDSGIREEILGLL